LPRDASRQEINLMDPLLHPELVAAAARVIDANRAVNRHIAVAESCTGGLVCAALTALPGSSDVFDIGFITYANDAKIKTLGVGSEIIETFGAVSIASAWSMARGALDKSDADIAVSITGVAGPDGGTLQKPVGTVVFARAVKGSSHDDIVADTRQFEALGRDSVRLQAALVALELLMPDWTP
jgi:nicotinamide-nucleotide amidase